MLLASSRALIYVVRSARLQECAWKRSLSGFNGQHLNVGNVNTASKVIIARKDRDNGVFPFSIAALITCVGAAVAFGCEKKTMLEDSPKDDNNDDHDDDDATTILNWSGTHSVNVRNEHFYEPESIEELEQVVATCHEKGLPIRPVGSALSPNAISFQSGGMISLSNLDDIINIDKENMTVTVQAGARVSQVVEALREHGLTLPNLASIAEQQMGGFVQIGAHGTGANIASVDEYVTSLKLVTPAKGTIHLTAEDGELFQLAKVAIGALGVVSEITMKCIPAHKLVEHTYVLKRSEAKTKINSLLKKHKHIRYMWIPYEDAVVVVTNDPEDNNNTQINTSENSLSVEDRMQPLTDALKQLSKFTSKPYTDEMLTGMGFGEIRDALLALAPLDYQLVREVNKAEAEFWRKSEGYQTKPSDQLLQFDCGGQQWVFEVCFPTGTYDDNKGKDMEFMEDLLEKIESTGIPAPAPIEQRWSASTSSLMSPSHGEKGGLHCWVGVIMYLPSDDEKERKKISDIFKGQYCDLVRRIGLKYHIMSHWAKLEMPNTSHDLEMLRATMKMKYPVEKFNAARSLYDPKNLLSNDLINSVFGSSGKS